MTLQELQLSVTHHTPRLPTNANYVYCQHIIAAHLISFLVTCCNLMADEATPQSSFFLGLIGAVIPSLESQTENHRVAPAAKGHSL